MVHSWSSFVTSEWPMTFWLFHDFTVISCVLKISHLPTINHRPTKESCGDAASWDCPLIAGLGYSRDLSRLDLAITWISALSLSLLLEHCHSLSSQFVPIVQTPVHRLIQVRRLFLLPIVTRGVSHRSLLSSHLLLMERRSNRDVYWASLFLFEAHYFYCPQLPLQPWSRSIKGSKIALSRKDPGRVTSSQSTKQ